MYFTLLSYNKGSHPKPFMTAAAITKSKSTRDVDAPDYEDAIETENIAEDENEESDDEGVGADRLIKVNLKTSGQTGASKKGSKGKGKKK